MSFLWRLDFDGDPDLTSVIKINHASSVSRCVRKTRHLGVSVAPVAAEPEARADLVTEPLLFLNP